MSGLGWPRKGVLPWGFGSPTHGPSSRAPAKWLLHLGEGLGCREQYPASGSAHRGNPCATEVSHPSPLGGSYTGVGPIASPDQPLDSGAQGPGAGSEALSCRHPRLGWFSVRVRGLEEARATGLPCPDAYPRLLTRSSLRSPGGPKVRSRLLLLVGRLYSGRGVVPCCVRGCSHRRAWRTMVTPDLRTPFLF